MYALILPFVLMAMLAVFAALNFDLSSSGGDGPVSEPGQAASAQVGNFVATAHAVLAFAENNEGYSGTPTSQQLQPYMNGENFPSQWSASMENGLTTLWSNALPAGAISGIGTETQTDCAYAQVINGQMQSECGVYLGSAPHGATEGSVVYVVENPT